MSSRDNYWPNSLKDSKTKRIHDKPNSRTDVPFNKISLLVLFNCIPIKLSKWVTEVFSEGHSCTCWTKYFLFVIFCGYWLTPCIVILEFRFRIEVFQVRIHDTEWLYTPCLHFWNILLLTYGIWFCTCLPNSNGKMFHLASILWPLYSTILILRVQFNF